MWLEQLDTPDPLAGKPAALRPNAEEKLHDLWKQTFQLLNVSGLEKADTIRKSLEDITRDAPGKQSAIVVLNRLKHVFNELGDIGLRQEVEAARSYLENPSEGSKKNLGELLKAMFGEHFDKLYGGEDRASDTDSGLTGVQGSTPPVDTTSGTDQIPTPPDQMGQSDPNDPNAIPGKQPQVPPAGTPLPPQPTNPTRQMPQVPAGVYMGMY
jgi:hypothetical protein